MVGYIVTIIWDIGRSIIYLVVDVFSQNSCWTLFGFYDDVNDKQIALPVHMPAKDVWIDADELAITRILENLISNAMTYAKENIAVELKEPNSSIVFIIKNDAPTLTETDVEFLFDRFYRVDQARSSHHAGLGLSIVKSLMQKMNDKINPCIEDEQLVITCGWDKAKLSLLLAFCERHCH